MAKYQIGIREAAEFLYRSGPLNVEAGGVSGLDGTRMHQYIQARQGPHYQKEVFLKITVDDLFTLAGRADGIDQDEDGFIVHEIKTTMRDLDSYISPVPHHLAQAKIYAYIYACDEKLDGMKIKITYVHLDDRQSLDLVETYSFSQLKEWFENTVTELKKWLNMVISHRETRDESITAMRFPYETLREHQKEMALTCLKAMRDHEVLFLQAATGIGKTLSVLYPALKGLALNYHQTIFYATAKNVTQIIPQENIALLKKNGLKLRTIRLTAKERICPFDLACDTCEYAARHYDHVNMALENLIKNYDDYDRGNILETASQYQVCPFEISLDLALFCDVIIGDMNYVFDPKVSLKNLNRPAILVDEAHNLVDRGRAMFSASLNLETLKEAEKAIHPKKGALYETLKALIKECEKTTQKELDTALVETCTLFTLLCQKAFLKMPEGAMKEALTNAFFEACDIIRIAAYYNEDFITTYHDGVQLVCLDPSRCLISFYQNASCVILFSATLLPIRYFYQLLGGQEKDHKYYFPSPFDPNNRLLCIARDFNARYSSRENSLPLMRRYFELLKDHYPGHYLVYFPSYAYLDMAYEYLNNNIPVIRQENQMSEEKKEDFLSQIEKDDHQTVFFFAVLGGMFSEGLDLKGEQLIGVVIVSLGLPNQNENLELIKDHFDYDVAYVYPAFNKVLQAAGRLIRTSDDKGIILLLDDRFTSPRYRALYPLEWSDIRTTDVNGLAKLIASFKKNLLK